MPTRQSMEKNQSSIEQKRVIEVVKDEQEGPIHLQEEAIEHHIQEENFEIDNHTQKENEAPIIPRENFELKKCFERKKHSEIERIIHPGNHLRNKKTREEKTTLVHNKDGIYICPMFFTS